MIRMLELIAPIFKFAVFFLRQSCLEIFDAIVSHVQRYQTQLETGQITQKLTGSIMTIQHGHTATLTWPPGAGLLP